MRSYLAAQSFKILAYFHMCFNNMSLSHENEIAPALEFTTITTYSTCCLIQTRLHQTQAVEKCKEMDTLHHSATCTKVHVKATSTCTWDAIIASQQLFKSQLKHHC